MMEKIFSLNMLCMHTIIFTFAIGLKLYAQGGNSRS